MNPLDFDVPLSDCDDALHTIARQRTGHEDFGPDDYREGLGVLLQSLDADADLSPAGRQAAVEFVVTALAGRLVSQASFAANPSYCDVRIEAPIIVVGLPRTGTTALHRMLCSLDGHQGLELWLGQNPMPRPAREDWPEQPGFVRTTAMLEAQHAAAPEMRAIHEMAPDQPDECWNLLRQTFTSVTFECLFAVTTYSRWWATSDMTAAYARWADNLRLVGMNARERRWILKDPSHLFAPEALLAALPDATIVMTHRDPAKSIPSVCSLNATARRGNDRAYDAAKLGREQQELWARGIDRLIAARESCPDRFVDVHFHDLVEDPVAVLCRIGDRSGTELTEADERAARDWLSANPARPHRYEDAECGLSDEAVRERDSEYVEHFGVRLER